MLLRALPLATLLAAALAAPRDLFLRPARFVVPADARITVDVVNGTFDSSVAALPAAHLADLTLAGPAGRRTLPRTDWGTSGDRAVLQLRTGAPGIYVLGVSTHARTIAMPGAQFDAHLEQVGRRDVLEARRAAGTAGRAATERYAKHVKALLHVGAARDSGWARALGYGAEIVPLADPYGLHAGDSLAVRCLVNGRPAAGLPVYAGGADAGVADARAQIGEQALRTDADGVVRLRLPAAGPAWVRFIHMTPTGAPGGPEYESQWATLTFAVPPAP
jgi:hypothetical protein